jgi:hypothetical protein
MASDKIKINLNSTMDVLKSSFPEPKVDLPKPSTVIPPPLDISAATSVPPPPPAYVPSVNIQPPAYHRVATTQLPSYDEATKYNPAPPTSQTRQAEVPRVQDLMMADIDRALGPIGSATEDSEISWWRGVRDPPRPVPFRGNYGTYYRADNPSISSGHLGRGLLYRDTLPVYVRPSAPPLNLGVPPVLPEYNKSRFEYRPNVSYESVRNNYVPAATEGLSLAAARNRIVGSRSDNGRKFETLETPVVVSGPSFDQRQKYLKDMQAYKSKVAQSIF